MFGFGISEVITLLIVAIVFINPKDMPGIVRKMGRIYGKIMRQVNMLKKTYSDFEQEVESVKSDIDITKTKTIKGVKSC